MHPFSTPENIWYFQGLEKGCIGNKWVTLRIMRYFLFLLIFVSRRIPPEQAKTSKWKNAYIVSSLDSCVNLSLLFSCALWLALNIFSNRFWSLKCWTSQPQPTLQVIWRNSIVQNSGLFRNRFKEHNFKNSRKCQIKMNFHMVIISKTKRLWDRCTYFAIHITVSFVSYWWKKITESWDISTWTQVLNFVCKRFTVQTLLWSLEFVIQINIEHDTIAIMESCWNCYFCHNKKLEKM